MEKKVVVISLGGSLIVPDKIDHKFLAKFKEVIKKNLNKYRFVVVCGGGSVARKYISALKENKASEKIQGMVGISVTRLNARFLTYFFGKDANEGIPHDMKQVANLLKKNEIVFCGALRYHENETSDGTAAKLANYFKTEFINLTNVPGLYNKNPKKFKNAKFIPEISAEALHKIINKIKYHPGQHFVIDQNAIKIIKDNKIKTYILGKELKNLDNLLNNKKFKGTIVY